MSITAQDIKAEIVKLEDEAETAIATALAAAAQFARSTLSALAKDPVMTAALQAAFSDGLSQVLMAVETHGASILPSIVKDVATAMVVSVGGTAEHELVSVVAGELHAAASAPAAAVPETVNP